MQDARCHGRLGVGTKSCPTCGVQTRFLAAASGALLVLGLALFAPRPAIARPATTRTACRVGESRSVPLFPGYARTTAPRHPPSGTESSEPAAILSPELRADLALTDADPVRRTAALAEILCDWAATDAASALVWVELHPSEDRAFLVQAIGEGLAADPVGATLALVYLAQDHDTGAPLAGALVRALAAGGRTASAMRLVQAKLEGWNHEWATVAFANLAYEDAAAALEAIAPVGDPSLRRTIAAAIIAGWSERDPAELARNVDAFAQPEERANALATALAKWALRDPAAAHSFVASVPTHGES
jgi:hypothetical protein